MILIEVLNAMYVQAPSLFYFVGIGTFIIAIMLSILIPTFILEDLKELWKKHKMLQHKSAE